MADERIRVTLEADSSQLTSEFRKAQARAEELSKRAVPELDRQIAIATRRQQDFARSIGQTKKSMSGAGQGFLNLAFFADDLQYGIRGVLNNIPALVLGLGGGAGLAGVLSLVALAGSQALPYLKQIFGGELDPAKAEELASKMDTLRQKTEEFARARGAASARDWVRTLQEEGDAVRTLNDELVINADLMASRRRAKMEVESARAEFQLAAIDADPRLSSEQKFAQKQAVQAEQQLQQARARVAEIKEAAAAAGKAAKDSYDAVAREQERRRKIEEQIREEEAARSKVQAGIADGELAEASLPGARARLERLQNLQEELALTGTPQERANQYLAELEKARTAVADLEVRARGAADANRRQREELDASLKVLREAVAASALQEKSLVAAARLEAKRRDAVAERLSLEQEAAKRVLEYREKARQSEQESRSAPGADAKGSATVELGPGQMDARKVFEVRMKALELEAKGRADIAEGLRKELELRLEAAELAKSMGTSEAAALALLRERERLERQIEFNRLKASNGERKRAEAYRSPIRRSENDMLGRGGGSRLEVSTGLQGPRGLSRSAQRFAEREKLEASKSEFGAATKSLAAIEKDQNRLVQLFEKLGIW